MTSLLLGSRYRPWRLRLAIILYLLVLILGSVPGARLKLGELASGGVLHSLTYGVITLLLFTGLKYARLRNAALAVLTVIFMGALDEYVQSFFPYRSATVHDWLVDIAAAAITAAALYKWWPQRTDA
ncbi:VanZ family protein [Undibacterium terreum]|uniref:VanZ family protein n=1 Tax=Undibacterium terreum TaxID=1224302 RepID=UPI001E3B3BB7|nr:VanZ family protein [Undibacterium terreum]